jgi:predicted transcriptional regulator
MSRKRPQLGIIVTQETKNRVEQMARESGRSMGQVAEQLIEEALHNRRILAAITVILSKEHVG